MTEPAKNEQEIATETTGVLVEAEKAKPVPPKPPISRSGPAFPQAHQFRGPQGHNVNNRQRPGRAANRGR